MGAENGLELMEEKGYDSIKEMIEKEGFSSDYGYLFFVNLNEQNCKKDLQPIENLPRLMIKKMLYIHETWPEYESIKDMKKEQDYQSIEKLDLETMVKEKGMFKTIKELFTIEELDIYGI